MRSEQLPGGSREGAFPTSEQNKILIRRWLGEVLSRGDLATAEELFTQNYALHDPSFPYDVHGSAGIKWYVTAYRVAFPNLQVDIEDQLAEEDKVVTRWTVRGTHSGEFLGLTPTGDEVTVSGIEFDRIVRGRIDEGWVGYHPFAEQLPTAQHVGRGFVTVGEAFSDLRMAEADSVTEGNKLAFRWLLSGTHEGEFMGVAGTGRRVEAMGMDILRVADGQIVEHWGEFDAMGLLRQIGAIPRLGDTS
ncbi:MAG: ester cyclase [Actinomycetota bacterium]|nr:ester cyclase [Actinomycetota bacterium]MDQ5817225.1 ester cyclase [Actinomycetota bacterium]